MACNFVTRAKRAHHLRTSWEDFAERERQIDSAALTEREYERRELEKLHVLDNDLRIAILDKLAPRLCKEIWGIKYTPRADTPNIGASRGGPLPPEMQQENYEMDPDRTVSHWVPGGKYGANPVFRGGEVSEDDDWINGSSNHLDGNDPGYLERQYPGLGKQQLEAERLRKKPVEKKPVEKKPVEKKPKRQNLRDSADPKV